MRRALHRLQRRLLDERGYSLVELMIVMVILGIVLGSLTTVFVSGTRAELDLNRRFQAQQNTRLALDKIRREAHCASSATVTGGSVTLVLPTQCPSGSGSVTWYTAGSGLRWGLYRQMGAAPAVKHADYLTTGSVFSYVPQSALTQTQLPKLQVNFPVDIDTSSAAGTYRLIDGIALRNSSPAKPVFISTTPTSPANNNNPSINGTAEAGSTVALYTDSGCTSAVAGSGPATGGSFSIAVTVADDNSTTFYGIATDGAGNSSACSTSSITYVEDS